MRKLPLVVMLAAVAPWACAQRATGTAVHFPAPTRPVAPAANGIRSNFAFARAAHPSRFPRTAPFASQFFPLLEDWSSPEDLYAAGYPVASQLPYFVMQGGLPAVAETVDRQREAPTESLLIELQGDRYVRVSGNQESGGPSITLEPDQLPQVFSGKGKRSAQPSFHASVARQPTMRATPANPAATPLPAVVLVLRDGTRQEVRDYTIADGALYARGDFYTDGYWNKTIRLSTVNVAETLSANNSRGVKFILPSAPNEVITRP
jgi:hypothetical protein